MIKKIKNKLSKDANLKELLSGSAITFILKMTGMLLSYILIFIISKKIGTVGVGQYNLFNQILTVTSMFVGLGLNIAVLRYVGEFNNTTQVSKMHLLYRNIIKIVTPSSFLLGVVFYIFSNEISYFIYESSDKTFMFKIIGISLPFFAVNQISVEFIRGLKKLQISELIRSVIRPLIILILIFTLWNQTLTIDILLIMFLIGSIIVSLLSRASIWSFLKNTPKNKDDNFKIKELLTTSFPIMAVSVSTALMVAIPIFILDYWGNQDELGVFTVSYKLSQLVTIILLIVNTMSAPKFAELYWSKKIDQLQKLLIQSSKVIFWVAFLFSAILIIFSSNILGLFGADFTKGSWVLIILVIGQLVNASTGSVGVLVNMTGNQKLYRRSILTILSLFLLICPLATIHFGMIGTAITTSFSVILLNLWLVISVRKKLKLKTSYPF